MLTAATDIKTIFNRKSGALLFCLLVNVIVLAQIPPSKQWDVRFGGDKSESGGISQKTVDGGYILGGYSFSGISGDKTEVNRGLVSDYWIVKIDSNGTKQWDKTFGGTDFETLTSLKQTTDGGYILCGYSSSGISGEKTQASRGSSDYWLVKTDANGIKQWDATFGGDASDGAFSVQQTSDSGYIIGGTSFSHNSGDKSQLNWGGGDYWVVKINANGIKQWDAAFGGDNLDELFSLQQTIDGGYILGGTSLSGISGNKTQPNWGENDYWVVKIDVNGTKQWDARYGGTGPESCNSLQQTTDGGYIIGGNSGSDISGDKTQSSRGAYDYWVVKADANGIKEWDARFGGSGGESFRALQQTRDGGYILGGSSGSEASGDKTQNNQGLYDYWIIKTDVNGEKEWDARFGGNGWETLYSLGQTNDGGFILGGESPSGINGDKTQDSRGAADYWVVKIMDIFFDEDKDGLGYYKELTHSTDPKNFDTNGDGLADGVNVFVGLPPLHIDTDGDGISNIQEKLNGTSPVLFDTDKDGVSDALDPFPLDRSRRQLPPVNLSDHTAPVITLQEPVL